MSTTHPAFYPELSSASVNDTVRSAPVRGRTHSLTELAPRLGTSRPPAASIEELFCARFHCSAAQFTTRAFWHCLYFHSRPVAPLLSRLFPDMFAADFELLRQLAAATDMREAKAALSKFSEANRWPRTFWRGTLRLRLSGRRATRLAQELFAAAD